MNWKALLAVFIIVGILGLLMITDVGKTYVDFLSSKVGNFLSTLLDLNLYGGESFRILLDTEKTAFYGQKYSISNTSLSASGICQSSVTVGNTIMQMSGQRCSVEAQNARGQFEYTVGGSVKFVGVADMLIVNEYPFLSTGKPFDVNFEVIPLEDFKLLGLSQGKIQLNSITGSIESWKGDTKLSIDNLLNSRITVSNFDGDMRMDGNSILLIGMANSVKGDSFSW